MLVNFFAEFTYPYKEEEPPMEIWMVQTDGLATKKVGGEGVVLISPKGEILKYAIRLQFPAINNEVEYKVLQNRAKSSKSSKSKESYRPS